MYVAVVARPQGINVHAIGKALDSQLRCTHDCNQCKTHKLVDGAEQLQGVRRAAHDDLDTLQILALAVDHCLQAASTRMQRAGALSATIKAVCPSPTGNAATTTTTTSNDDDDDEQRRRRQQWW